MKLRKRIMGLTMAMCLALSTVGCGSSASQGESGQSSAPSSEKVTIKLLTQYVKGSDETGVKAFGNALQRFTDSHPNVDLVVESIDPSNYPVKAKTLALGDQLPDVFEVEASALSLFVNTGKVAELDDFINNSDYYKNKGVENAYGELTLDGKIYGIPKQMCPNSLVFYNKAMLKDCGFDSFPTEWPQFIELINKLNEKNITPIALGNKEKWVAVSCIFSTLADRFTGTQWLYDVKAGKAKFTDPEFIKALEAVVELKEINAFNADMNSLGSEEQRALFNNGKAAMFCEGSWAVSTLENAVDSVKDNIGIAILPGVDGGKGVKNGTAGGTGFGFSMRNDLSEEQKIAAQDLISELTGEQYFKELIEDGGDAAFVVENYDTANLSQSALAKNELMKDISFVPTYDVQLPPEVYSIVYDKIQELLVGTSTPEECAEAFQAAMDEVEE